MSLDERLDTERAEGWRPHAGDRLVGVIVAEDEGRDFKGERYPIVTLRTQEGEEIALHAFHDVLKNELGRLRPKLGDEIGVRYDGKDEDKGYHRYRVVGGSADGIDWDRYGEHEAEAAAPGNGRASNPPPPPQAVGSRLDQHRGIHAPLDERDAVPEPAPNPADEDIPF